MEKTVALFRKASTIIVLTTIVLWFLKYFNFSFQHVELDQSILADIGRFLSTLFVPPGLASCKRIAAMIIGYVTKDNMLATVGVLFGEGAVNGNNPASRQRSLLPAVLHPFLPVLCNHRRNPKGTGFCETYLIGYCLPDGDRLSFLFNRLPGSAFCALIGKQTLTPPYIKSRETHTLSKSLT